MVIITPRGGIQQSVWSRATQVALLLRLWSARELRARYRQSWLRAGWSVIQPLVLLITYGWILNAVLDVREEGVPYLVFAWSGLVPFAFVQQSLGQGVGSIQQAGHIVTKVYFPREVLPLSVIVASLVDLAVTSLLLLVVSWVQVGPPSVTALGVVPVFLVLLLWCVGLTLLACTLMVFRRDIGHAMPLILRALFIVTPVLYPAALLVDRAPLLAWLNPFTVVTEGVRDSLIRTVWPDWKLLGAHLVGGAVVTVIGFAVVRRSEQKMVDLL